jgi:alkyl hydroperoxide reductase subunit F
VAGRVAVEGVAWTRLLLEGGLTVLEPLWDEETGAKIAEALSEMAEPVLLLLFVEDDPGPESQTQQSVVESVAALSDKLTFRIVSSREDAQEVKAYAIDKFPATVVLGQRDHGIRFFGVTTGQEFASFLEAIKMVSSGDSGLDADLGTMVRGIDVPVHLQVFVTLTCPYCARMVHTAHQFATLNDQIRADMIESSQFLDLAEQYQVETVPKTIINETTALEGAQPAFTFYLAILQAVNPEAYRQIEATVREMEGVRNVVPLEEGRVYDLIIIGGGPAALSAALYAARKKLSVGLVAERMGGQLTYTAQIDNYLGLPGVGGDELMRMFQDHAELYPLAELAGVPVTAVVEAPEGFVVLTDDGRALTAQAIIYCAGKEYNRLGVPNEERFMGHGIAFCATCDAPLYSGRRVAVVGGANSALTAARDLLSFASVVHLIHRRETFTADATLLEEIEGDPRIRVHTPCQVRAFVGDERLTGVEIASREDGQTQILEVDGVFLEIGLSPNSDPVSALVTLNERGEIPVHADGSTELPGFFAAGDVTDVPEKQIAIAVGQGALAALSAYEYLVERGLVTRQPELEAQWG